VRPKNIFRVHAIVENQKNENRKNLDLLFVVGKFPRDFVKRERWPRYSRDRFSSVAAVVCWYLHPPQ